MVKRRDVVESKIQVPSVPQNFIVRDRLIKQFDYGNCKLFVLHATVGYGKTVLVTHFAANCDANISWYHLNETDNDIVTFMQYLTASVEQIYGKIDFDINTYEGLEMDEAAVKNLGFDFVRQLNYAQIDAENDTYMVLDDFQTISNEKINTIIETVLQNLDSRIHVIVATKGLIPKFWGKFFLEGTAKMITQEELCFTIEEVADVMKQNIVVDENFGENCQNIYENVEGWPAGIMFEILYMKHTRTNHYSHNSQKSVINDYIMRELYRTLPYDIQMFLATTSILEYLSVDVCNAVMNITNSRSILTYLVQENLFIINVGEGRKMYRYHSMFKDFLSSRLKDEQKSEAMRLAANYYLHTDNKEQAVEYAIKGGNVNLMQYAMGIVGVNLVNQGKLSTMQRWIEWLNECNAVLTPTNTMIYGMYYYKLGNNTLAMEYIEQASKLFIASMDESGYIRNMIEKARIVRNIASLAKSNEIIETALGRMKKNHSDLWASVVSEQLYNLVFMAEYDRAYELCESMLSEALETGNKKNEARFLQFMIMINFYRGNYEDAMEISEELTGISQEDRPPLFFSSNIYIAIITALQGKLPEAEELIVAELETKIENNRQEDIWLIYIFNALMDLYANMGEAKDIFSYKGSLRWKHAVRQIRMAERKIAFLSNDHVFKHYLRAAKSLLADKSYAEMTNKEIDEVFENTLKNVPAARDLELAAISYQLFLCEKYEETEEFIRRSLQAGAGQTENISRLHMKTLLALLLREKKRNEAVEIAKAATSYCRVNDLAFSFLCEKNKADFFALMENETIYEEKKVTVKAFGEFSAYVNSGDVEIKWRTKKAQELFAFLFSMGGQPISKEKIIGLLWPDTSLKSATSLLHTTLYSIRKKLADYEIESLFVYDMKKYSINMDMIVSDVKRFDDIYRQFDEKNSIDISADELCSLYCGQYLENIEGEFAQTDRVLYERKYTKLCRAMAEREMQNGKYEDVISLATKVMSVNEFEEGVYVMLMRAYSALGDMKNVKLQYDNLKQMMSREFGADISPEVQKQIDACFKLQVEGRSVN